PAPLRGSSLLPAPSPPVPRAVPAEPAKAEPGPFPGARRIPGPRLRQEDRYAWISTGEALLLRVAPEGKCFRASRIDTSTGRETALDALTARFGRGMRCEQMNLYTDSGVDVIWHVPDCPLSPDGRWLRWEDRS